MTSAVQDSQTPRCLTCDYPLLSLSENRCPECGRGFDPADPRTMRTPRSPGKIARYLLQPPRWSLHSFVGLAVLVSILAGAAPGGYFLPAMLAILTWMIILIVWGLRLLLWLVLRGYFEKDCSLGPRHARRWIVTPLSLAVVAALLLTRTPLYVAFWFSRPSMNALAKAVINGTEPKTVTKWVGLFYVDDIKQTSVGVRFRVPHASSYDFNGFIWSSSPLPPVDTNGNQYSPLDDRWYTCHTSF